MSAASARMNLASRFWRPIVRITVFLLLLSDCRGRNPRVHGPRSRHDRAPRHRGLRVVLRLGARASGGPLTVRATGPARYCPCERCAEPQPTAVTALFLPFALLPAHVALAAWVVLSLLALADTLRIVVRETGWPVLSLGSLAALVSLFAWAPTAALVITAQLGLLIAWPVARAWRAARRGEWTRAGWWVGFASGLKPFLLLLLPWLAARRQWAAAARAIVGLGLLAVAGMGLFGPGAYIACFQQFGDVTWHGHYMNASIWGLLDRALAGFRVYSPIVEARWVAPPMWLLLGILVLMMTFRHFVRASADVDRDTALVLAAALLVSPLGWVYYFWLLVPPSAALFRGGAENWGICAWTVAGLVGAGTLWHASAIAWGQPSGVATLTIGSPYFWALTTVWLRSVGAECENARADSDRTGAWYPWRLRWKSVMPRTTDVGIFTF
jgi:hypothetical protein